jgi:hypothetical protein
MELIRVLRAVGGKHERLASLVDRPQPSTEPGDERLAPLPRLAGEVELCEALEVFRLEGLCGLGARNSEDGKLVIFQGPAVGFPFHEGEIAGLTRRREVLQPVCHQRRLGRPVAPLLRLQARAPLDVPLLTDPWVRSDTPQARSRSFSVAR